MKINGNAVGIEELKYSSIIIVRNDRKVELELPKAGGQGVIRVFWAFHQESFEGR